MPYLTINDLKTHLYQEIIGEIVRDDASIAQEAIEAAIDMSKAYLSKYDLVKLFGTESIEPEVNSPALKRNVKDLACWYVLTLGNANIHLELFKELSDNALKWLRDIQKGLSNPDWPYQDTSVMGKPAAGDAIEFSSNPKRINHW